MKKVFSVIIFLAFILSANAERNNRIGVQADFDIGSVTTENDDDYVTVNFHFGAEYQHVFDCGFIIGGDIGIGATDMEATLQSGILQARKTYTGDLLSFSTFLGYGFGEKRNFQLLLYPIIIESVSLTHLESTLNGRTVVDKDVDLNCMEYKFGIRLCKVWGEELFRHGFYVGLNAVGGSGDIDTYSGGELVLGYKLSFAF